MRKTVTLVIATALLGLPFVAGCTTESSITCFDWVDYASPEATAADADLVIIGTVTGSTESVTFSGSPATAHELTVERVLKGELSEETILVTSTPETCTSNGPYPTGDPMDSVARIELFLHSEDGTWRTITPRDGAVVVPDGGPLPWEPPAAP
jgi:hypothetical protein